MPRETVTLALNSGTDIGFGEFAEAVAHFDKLLKALSEAVAGRKDPVEWRFGEVVAGSAVVTVDAEHPKAPVVARDYLKVGRALDGHGDMPHGDRVRVPAEGLAAMLRNGVREIRFQTSEDDVVLCRNALHDKPAVVPLRPALGAIEGTVEVLSRRRGLHFNLYDSLHNRPVSCYVSAEHADLMRDIWGRRVIVQGLVSRDAERGWPFAVREVTRIERVPEVPPGSYRRARGILPRRPGQPRAEEAIRRTRDAV